MAKNSFWPVNGLRSRGPLKDMKSKFLPWSSRLCLVPFRTFRWPLFPKPVIGQELFLAVSHSKLALSNTRNVARFTELVTWPFSITLPPWILIGSKMMLIWWSWSLCFFLLMLDFESDMGLSIFFMFSFCFFAFWLKACHLWWILLRNIYFFRKVNIGPCQYHIWCF